MLKDKITQDTNVIEPQHSTVELTGLQVSTYYLL